MLDKLFNNSQKVTFYGTCKNCFKFLGKFEDLTSLVKCDNCKNIVDFSNPSCKNLFVIIDPSEGISYLFNAYSKEYNDIIYNKSYEEGHIRDIYDGQMY